LTGREPPDLIDPQNFSWNWRAHISLSPNLARILDRMLQLRPHDRFESAQDILTALKSGNVVNLANNPNLPSFPPVQPPLPIDPKSPVATPTQQPTAPSLLEVLGRTWIFIAAVTGAIGLGWLVASMTAKRPAPVRSSTISHPPETRSSRSISSTASTTVVIPHLPH